MKPHMEHDLDQLLQEAAKAHNAALPLQDWKERILARAEEGQGEIPAENILAFVPPARKPFYKKALPYACAAAALVVLFAGVGAMGGLEKSLMAPAAQAAPAAAAGADMAAAQEAPAEAAPAEPAAAMEIAETEGIMAYTTEDFENGVQEAPAAPAAPAPAPAAQASAADMPAEAPAAEAPVEEDAKDMGIASAASGRSMPALLALSGENSVALTPFSPEASLSDLPAQVEWLAIDPGEDTVPFRIEQAGEICHGRYGVYDADTLESLDYFLPSGLEPQTYLFQNAAPGGRYLVTVELDGMVYAFGVIL